MVRLCPPTLALPSAFVSGVKWAGKIPNISLESSSQTAGTITEKAAAPGTEAYETHHTCVLSAGREAFVGASFVWRESRWEITFLLLFSTVVEFRANAKRRLHSTPLLLEHRVHPASGENARRGPEAQIVHMLGDVEPSVHHACRDDNDVARLHDFLHDLVRHAATGWPVQVRRGVVASVDDVAVGEHRSAAGDDVVAFGLRIVSDAAGRPASRSSRHLAPARRGGRSCGSAPAGGCCAGRCPCGRNRNAIHCLPAMNDADAEVLVADVDGL